MSNPVTRELDRSMGDSASALSSLEASILGRVIYPASAEYDDSRKVATFLVDQRPLAIVQPHNADDVAATVQFARERGLPFTVRSGGHGPGQHGVIDDVLMLDMSTMNRVSIDPATRLARVEGGARSADVAAAAQPLGLALSTGDTRSVGLGGLVPGGGIGYMVRKHGLTIDSLLSAEIVLADGRIVTASPESNDDLFWAIRGGGGNFGVITEFTFQLREVGMILGGDLMLPASREVIRGYLDYVAAAPDGLTTVAGVMHAPPAPYVPQERLGEVVLSILVCWTGDPEEGAMALAPLRALAEPVSDTVGPIPYDEIFRYTDHYSMPHGLSLRMMFADDLSDAAIDAALDAIRNSTSPFAMLQIRGLGGAMGRVGPDATAFAHRTAPYFVGIMNVWLDPGEERASHQAWTDSLWEKIRAEGRGANVSFLEREGEERIHDAYSPATYQRLAAVKAKYDPENVFRFNQNIRPAQS